jgi:hypothetical protein
MKLKEHEAIYETENLNKLKQDKDKKLNYKGELTKQLEHQYKEKNLYMNETEKVINRDIINKII